MKSIITLLIVLIIVYVYMVAPRIFRKGNRKPFLNRHYAHRGLFDNAGPAPENSLAAICKAADAGYGIEFDVQLSKDDVPIVFHDDTLQRMCGVEGKVWDYTLAELQQMKLMHSQETIPTFEEVLKAVDGRVPLIIEYKLDRQQTKVCALSEQILAKYQGDYCIECFHPLALIWYRKNRPKVLRGQLCEEHFRNERFKGNPIYVIMSYLLTNFVTRPDFIAYNYQHASNFSRRMCRWLGGLSIAYTIKSEDAYKEAQKEFDLFIFDSFILK